MRRATRQRAGRPSNWRDGFQERASAAAEAFSRAMMVVHGRGGLAVYYRRATQLADAMKLCRDDSVSLCVCCRAAGRAQRHLL